MFTTAATLIGMFFVAVLAIGPHLIDALPDRRPSVASASASGPVAWPALVGR